MNFCVYITEYKGSKMPRWYLGSSSIKKVLAGYRGSVSSKAYKSLWESELRENADLFSTRIIEVFGTRKEALDAEYQMQEALNVVHDPRFVNLALAAKNGFFGRSVFGTEHHRFGSKHTAESRLKMSQNGKAISRGLGKSRPKSEEAKRRMSAAAVLRWSNPEQRKQNSEALKKHIKTTEHRNNIRKALIGYKHTDEMKAKISALHSGRKRTAESVAKTAAAHTGMKRTEETKQKLREAWARRRVKPPKEKPNG